MQNSSRWKSLIAFAVVLVGLLVLRHYLDFSDPREVTQAELVAMVERGEIEHATIGTSHIEGDLRDSAETVVAARIPGIEERELIAAMQAQGVDYEGKPDSGSGIGGTVLLWLAPLLLLGALWAFAANRVASKMSGPMAFGKTNATDIDRAEQTGMTFADVAGVDEAIEEMREVVDFLEAPQKYIDVGAKIPKGVLLVGAPGTGKTLLARAVAGEANAPFFSLTGSDFVEMFVGVGAARVRDLFAKAVERAPCILFIDEIDAIGKARGKRSAMGTHEEREQTLNQLLSEMDGFDARAGVVVVAATNRPEVLDPALTRAGRFDRRVIVDRPSRAGREAILEVHARHVPMDDDVDLSVVARRTPGMVGADLEKVINEAALGAARREATKVTQADLDDALDRIQLGLEQRSRAMTDEEKKRVAYHESGHAVVAAILDGADPVHRVTIIPRSVGALGATLQLPDDDRYLMLESELLDRICVLLGGRAAERHAFDEVSTGAEDDLDKATMLARRMVCRFGMSEAIGARSIGPRAEEEDDLAAALGGPNHGERRTALVDDEIDRILGEQEDRACAIVRDHAGALDDLVDTLLENETVEGDELRSILASDRRLRAKTG